MFTRPNRFDRTVVRRQASTPAISLALPGRILALVCALLITACQPAATPVPATPTLPPPTATTAPPTATAVPPTATPLPPTDTAVPPTETHAPPTPTSPPPTVAGPLTDTAPFAGLWTGSMTFSNDPSSTIPLEVNIPEACALRQACGYMKSPNSACRFEISFLGIQNNVFRYGFLSTLTGACPPIGTGTLTLQEDGTLFRRHNTTGLTISGPLTAVQEMSSAPAGSLETGPFAGRWAGSVTFSDAPNLPGESIVVSIPAACELGRACGQIENTTIRCTWEMELLSLEGDVLRYKFSQTLSGDCDAPGTGTLTLQADGRLLREHALGSTTVVGRLRSMPDEP